MIKSTMLAVLAAALLLPACAMETSPNGATDEGTGTTREAQTNNGCQNGYVPSSDGVCVISSDPPSSGGPTGGSPPYTPINTGSATAGSGGGGTVGGLPNLKLAACIARCEDARDACHGVTPLQAAVCNKTLAACIALCESVNH